MEAYLRCRRPVGGISTLGELEDGEISWAGKYAPGVGVGDPEERPASPFLAE